MKKKQGTVVNQRSEVTLLCQEEISCLMFYMKSVSVLIYLPFAVVNM